MHSMDHNETVTIVDQGHGKRQSKLEKKQKNLYLSAHARHLLAALSLTMGISETAVVELLVREKAARENLNPFAPPDVAQQSL